ncbi:hypothetical protein B0H17DRAFT_698633 [Mycena rosella]|uniref:DUF6699 domain-containing protein n=1 Tax=Mycena rosella TaxID=1033263 RepID=A0AAD7GTS5_MYCRO|nr:hypothetical protein B0H17DRAFT_698633 [Mycena rosella]
MLYFDVGFDPRRPQNLRDNRAYDLLPLPDGDRNLPISTHCTIEKMIIECPHIGQITVKRSQGVRCIDVFIAIYDAYRQRLGRDEQPHNIDRYQRYFEQRCRDSPGSEAELRAGMRRVDLLRGKRIFDGLARSGPDWKLNIDRP